MNPAEWGRAFVIQVAKWAAYLIIGVGLLALLAYAVFK